MIDAMMLERQQDQLLGNEKIETIYFGGGTPSLLTPAELNRFLRCLDEKYEVGAACEITLETNPDDITNEKLESWIDAGVNRLSIGVQSFQEEDLKLMNRAHSAKEGLQAIENAKAQGISNISIDLMYGLPSLSDAQWKENLLQFIDLDLPHLSAYNLTLEEQSALPKMIELGKSAPLEEDKNVRQFELLMELLSEQGYEQYELSNFAKENLYSRHNSAYWSGKNYLGIGPSAHSYVQGIRAHNVAHNSKYITSMLSGEHQRVIEELSVEEQFNEYILVNLRRSAGIKLPAVKLKFPDYYNDFLLRVKAEIENQLLQKKADYIVLSPSGKLLADQITMRLFA